MPLPIFDRIVSLCAMVAASACAHGCADAGERIFELVGDYAGEGTWENAADAVSVMVTLHLAPNKDELVGQIHITGDDREANASVVVSAVNEDDEIEYEYPDCEHVGASVFNCPVDDDPDNEQWQWDGKDEIEIDPHADPGVDRVEVVLTRK
jgi:hypothetical protein